MKLDIEKFRVKPGDKVDLAAISTKADPKADKNEVENTLFPALKSHLESLQEKLWAENKQSIILVLQGMDAAYLLGRGKFSDEHGFPKKFDILLSH